MPVQRDLAPFSLAIVEGRPTIRGDCDIAAAREIEAWLATFDQQPLEVDVAGVTFLDAHALRALLNVRRRNRHLRLIAPSAAVMEILTATATTDYLIGDRDIFLS